METADVVGLRIEVPVASFRVPQAREYFETYMVPPPATVFGMLLSYVGEPWRQRHAGARLAMAMTSQPAKSTVLRTMHQFKKAATWASGNQRPDFQELLTQVELVVWVAPGQGDDEAGEGHGDLRAPIPLAERLLRAIENPESIDELGERFGALSLGESTHLVNSVSALRPGEQTAGLILAPSPQGRLTLPVWPDHVGSAGTRWGRYEFRDMVCEVPTAEMFTSMMPA